jgi:hypothetical protein
MESVSCTGILYLPSESVTSATPEVVITVTEGSGTARDRSTTLPETLYRDWDKAGSTVTEQSTVNNMKRTDRSNLF